jgi:hypothetical protein
MNGLTPAVAVLHRHVADRQDLLWADRHGVLLSSPLSDYPVIRIPQYPILSPLRAHEAEAIADEQTVEVFTFIRERVPGFGWAYLPETVQSIAECEAQVLFNNYQCWLAMRGENERRAPLKMK